MPTVHHFRVYDVQLDGWRVQHRKSTEERIRRVGGEIIPGTAEDVPAEELDDDGKHVGPPPISGFQRQIRF